MAKSIVKLIPVPGIPIIIMILEMMIKVEWLLKQVLDILIKKIEKKQAMKSKKQVVVEFLNNDNTKTEWTIAVLEEGTIIVFENGSQTENTKSSLRYIAEYIGFSYDKSWTTRQFGSKLIDHIYTLQEQDVKKTNKKSTSQKKDTELIEITPDTTIDDIYIAFTLKYPHLHLRFLSKSGHMDELIDSSKTVAEIRKEFNKKINKDFNQISGKISIAGNRILSELSDDFKKRFGLPSTWICCHYGKDLRPEPHGWDRTLSFAEQDSQEDGEYMIAGKRKISPKGELLKSVIDEDKCNNKATAMNISEIFAILGFLIADIDDTIDKSEIEMILGIAKNFEEYDIERVEKRLMLEKMRIRNYNSHKALAQQVPEKYRINMLTALTLVAVSDYKIKKNELDLLCGLSEIWDIEFEYANNLINNIVERFASSHTDRELEIEE